MSITTTECAGVMTAEQAREFRAAHDAEVVRLSRMSKQALGIEERRLMRKQGIQRVFGGPVLKDEYISSVLELRGYTTGRLNEATHVLCHQAAGTWSACEFCAGGAR